MYTLRFDGLFRGIPGGAGALAGAGFLSYGWLIQRDEIVIAKGHGVFARGKDASSNVAEYLGLIEGLEALRDLGVRQEAVRVCGDAKSIIDQMQGLSMVSSPRMKPLHRRASRLAKSFSNLNWNWMPRRHNRDADLLTRRAIRQIRLDPGRYQEAVDAIHPSSPSWLRDRLLPLIDLRIYQPAGSQI